MIQATQNKYKCGIRPIGLRAHPIAAAAKNSAHNGVSGHFKVK